MPLRQQLLASFICFGLAGPTIAQEEATTGPEPWVDPENPYTILLDETDESLDLWKERRDLENERSEPGPVNVQRYKMGHVSTGIPTFFHKPVALTPEDLKAGNVDVAIMGMGVEANLVGGAKWGPLKVRAAMEYGFWGDAGAIALGGSNGEVLISPFDTVTVVDYGDSAIDFIAPERTVSEGIKVVKEIAGAGVIPIVIGGDHTVPHATFPAMAEVYGKQSFGVLHFDSHHDFNFAGLGHYTHNGRWFPLAIRQGLIDPKNIVQIGIHGGLNAFDAATWDAMGKMGVKTYTRYEIRKRGWDAVMREAMQKVLDGPELLYVTFDIDVFDSVYVPGTTGREPGGADPNELLPYLRGIFAAKKVIGMDIVEYIPSLDVNDRTAILINRLMFEAITGLAMRKQGITDPFYTAPAVLEHK
jgi:agmatinase